MVPMAIFAAGVLLVIGALYVQEWRAEIRERKREERLESDPAGWYDGTYQFGEPWERPTNHRMARWPEGPTPAKPVSTNELRRLCGNVSPEPVDFNLEGGISHLLESDETGRCPE